MHVFSLIISVRSLAAKGVRISLLRVISIMSRTLSHFSDKWISENAIGPGACLRSQIQRHTVVEFTNLSELCYKRIHCFVHLQGALYKCFTFLVQRYFLIMFLQFHPLIKLVADVVLSIQ